MVNKNNNKQMSESKLLKKLKSDSRFIPFNKKYDFNYIKGYLKEVDKNETNDVKNKAFYTFFFNDYYVGLRSFFVEIFNLNKISKDVLINVLISFANRDLYLMSIRTNESLKGKKEFHYDKFINSSFQSSIEGFGMVNAQAGLEAGHDGLNSLLNIVNNTSEDWNNDKIDFNVIDNCAQILGFANIFTVVKSSYDIAIWEDYDINFNKENNELKIKCKNKEHQYLNRIGEYRLQRNVFSSKSIAIKFFLDKKNLIAVKKNRKAKRLKSVEIVDNKLKYKLADGKETKSVLIEVLDYSTISTYYGFIRNEKLPKFIDINLYDILVVYSEIKHLFKEAFAIKKTETSDNPENIDIYRIEFTRKELLEYLFAKTKYSKSQLKQLIDLFVSNNKYYNIWERPLIQIDSYIMPVLLPLLNGNILRTLDYWLEEGGFDLDERGIMFEKFIKKTLLDNFNRKRIQVKISEKNDFVNKIGEKEEIDLIIELKNLTIIAEIKCIKYPFDPRDYHNMHKRLVEGAEQVNRKTNFLEEHIEDFKDESFLSKKIIKIVVTNYPIFSGYIIEDVPIVDFSLLENYFINGALVKAHLIYEDNKLDINDAVNSIKYYNNEDELCNNLEDFLKNPLPIKEKLDDLRVDETQISLPDFRCKIFMDYINFKENNVI